VGFDERECTIEVTDDGPGIVDVGATTAPMVPPLDESGRGLRIIALVMDEVEVRQRRPRGTLLRLVKRLSWNQDQPNRPPRVWPR
jgi:anti-sigma regulatory factor (Ser/Thr protein kinase)